MCRVLFLGISLIEVKTVNGPWAGMEEWISFQKVSASSGVYNTSIADTPSRAVEIEFKCGSNTCETILDDPNRDNEFDMGAVDTFTGNMIGDCNGFTCDWDLDIELEHACLELETDVG